MSATEEKTKQKRRLRFKFYGKTDETYVFRKILDALSGVRDDVSIMFMDNALRVRQMDPAHVSMVDLAIPMTVFCEWDARGAGRKGVKVTFLLNDVRKLLSKVTPKSNQSLILKVDTAVREKKEYNAYLYVETVNGTTRKLRIPLMEFGRAEKRNELRLPKLRYRSTIRIVTRDLVENLRDIKYGDRFTLESTKDWKLLLYTQSDLDHDLLRTNELNLHSESILEYDIMRPSKSTYNIEMVLHQLNHLKEVAEVVKLSFGTDIPLKLSFNFPNEISYDYYIAPRIQ